MSQHDHDIANATRCTRRSFGFAEIIALSGIREPLFGNAYPRSFAPAKTRRSVKNRSEIKRRRKQRQRAGRK